MLRERLAWSRSVPEFTMQAVTSETGVPGDTLRSWQRRYGFPMPGRNDANYRLFSRRDIEAVKWVRDQTGRGQGTKEAIAMLRRITESAPAPASGHSSLPPVMPAWSLSNALLEGNLEAAQRAWDRLAITVSPDALCNDVILPAYRQFRESEPGPDIRLAADAFLLRKVVTLFDRSAPERGSRDVVVLTAGDAPACIPALALATVLSRSGFRLHLPVLDLRDAETVIVMQQLPLATAAIIVAPHGMNVAPHLLPNREIFHWWYDGPEPTSERTLPPSLLAVAASLPDPA